MNYNILFILNQLDNLCALRQINNNFIKQIGINMSNKTELSHVDGKGRAQMVDVSDKSITVRKAKAKIDVLMKTETMDLIRKNQIKKGDVLAVARVAGIMAAKKTSDLIPMCHPLPITSVEILMNPKENNPDFTGITLEIQSVVKTKDRTGVEMEALTAASVAALTVYDMVKAVDREIVINGLMLLEKEGGKSGKFIRK